MKIGVADYGMNVWYGGLYDIEERLADLKASHKFIQKFIGKQGDL